MPTTTQPEPPRKKKRRIRIFWIVCTALVGLVLFLVVGYAAVQIHLARKIEAELAKVKARGEPVTQTDWLLYNSGPLETDDLTQQWLVGIAKVHAASQDSAYSNLPVIATVDPVPYPGDPWQDEPAASKLFEEVAAELNHLAELVSPPNKVHVPLEAEHDYALTAETMDGMRSLSQLLSLRARWQVYRGDSAAAAESLIMGCRAAKLLEAVPTLRSSLVRIAMHHMTIQTMLDLLPHAHWSEAQLKRLQAEFVKAQQPRSVLRDVLLDERVRSLDHFDQPAKADFEVPTTYAWTSRVDKLYYLETHARLIEATELPYSSMFSEIKQIEQELESLSELKKSRLSISEYYLSAYTIFFLVDAQHAVRQRAAVTLLACQRYHLANDQWPAKLSDLVPEFLEAVPLDPFDGKPLRYQVQESAVIVYSIDQDLVDDGGEIDQELPSFTPDLVIELKFRE